MRAPTEYLQDMLEYIGYLESFGIMQESDLADIKTQLAVRKGYEVLGEIAKRLPDELLATQTGVNWRNLKGMRDVLIHRYDDVDLGLVWDALQRLPALRAAVEAMLANSPPSNGG